MQEPPDYPTGVKGQVYLPSLAPRGFADLQMLTSYFRWMGFDGLITQPANKYRRGSNDGPYSPFDHMLVDEDLGGEEALVAVNTALERAGITPIGDLVVNHVDEQSEIVQRALRDPEEWASWLRLTDDPARDGWNDKVNIFGLPTYHLVEELGRWRSTTFYPDQWELNFENPAVVDYICKAAETMLDRWGYGALRLDALAYVVGVLFQIAQGLDPRFAHNPPHPVGLAVAEELQHRVFSRRRRRPDGGKRRAFSIAEAGGTRRDIAGWLGVCDLAYDFEWFPAVLQSIDNGEWEPLRHLFATQLEVKGSYLRLPGSHDERQLRYSTYKDEIIRRHGGPNGEYVCFDGNGLTLRVRDLMPTEDAHVTALGVTILADGVPVLFQGEAEGYGGDPTARALDVRDPNRCLMPFDSRLPNAGWPEDAPYPLEPTWRTRSVFDQFRNPGSLLRRVQHFIAVRNAFDAVRWGDRIDIGSSDGAVLAFARTTPKGQTVFVFANASAYPRTAYLDLSQWQGKLLRTLVTDPAAYGPGAPDLLWEQTISWVDFHEYRADLAPYELAVIEAY